MKFSKEYKEAIKYLKKVPRLNYGGCLFSAYAIQQVCRNSGMKVPKIVILDTRSASIQTNTAFIRNESDEADSASHFGWTFGRILRDSDGVILPHYEKTLRIPLERTERFFKSAMENGCWNDRFDRKREIPRMERKLKVDLSY